MKNMKKAMALMTCVILGIVLSWLVCRSYFNNIIQDIHCARLMLISKQDMKLRLIDYKGNTLFESDIACGLKYGDKQKQGDMKTPEGIFSIADIQDSRKWTHDFHDGKGEIEGAYGSFFIRLSVPGYKGIGIHGTHDSLSIGTRATEGCIRLKNNDLEKLISMIRIPMTVIITPSVEDERNNSNKNYKNKFR